MLGRKPLELGFTLGERAEVLAHQRTDRRPSLGCADACGPIHVLGNGNRDVSHGFTISQSHSRSVREYDAFVVTGAVDFDGEEQSVDVEMIHPYRTDMLGFCIDMATHLRGWEGVMSWEAEYSVMRLDVRNPGNGQIHVDVMMR